MKHLDSEVNDAIQRLLSALCSWERATGRQSCVVIRENNGERPGEKMTEPGFVLRAVNGIPLNSGHDDLSDDWILRPLTKE